MAKGEKKVIEEKKIIKETRYCQVYKSVSIIDDDYYSRMTERLSDFLCTLALETSCEGAARIAQNMNIKVSGDTIIKILLKKYDEMKINTCSSTVGIDDFAFKKRHNYGTIIVDEKTHKPIAIFRW
ncbi:hypothetical protein [Clostridium sp. ZS1]|uniref:hypothetical protein n=1 Tax=Clostridium sp. ZS1 TaxID=2949989 RepID=UPI002079E5D2|nr:hypothetical protein [Clostridium sp. ZS1]